MKKKERNSIIVILHITEEKMREQQEMYNISLHSYNVAEA